MSRVDNKSGSAIDTGSAETSKSATEAAPQPSTRKGASMNSASAVFYESFARKRFDNAKADMTAGELESVLGRARLGEMTARSPDPQVRELGNTGATVTPLQLLSAWQTQLDNDRASSSNMRASEADAAFNDAAEWGRKVISELRGKRVYSLFGQLTSDANIITTLGAYEPELLLATRLAKHPELGGSSVLSRALDRVFVPEDIARLLEAQVKSMPRVESTVTRAANAAVAQPLQNTDILYGLLGGVANITTALQGVRSQWRMNGARALPSAAQLRDAATVGRLGEIFGSMQSALNVMPGTSETAELVFLLDQLLADPGTSVAVKRAALNGLDEAIRRATHDKPQVTVQTAAGEAVQNVYDGLATALAKFGESLALPSSPVRTIGTRPAAEVISELLGNALRVTNDARFAASVINAGAKVDVASAAFDNIQNSADRAQVVESLRNTALPENAAQVCGLIADRKERASAFADILAQTPDLGLSAGNAALLLDWPSDVPRTPFGRAALEASAKDIDVLPQNNLRALIDDPKATLDQVFDELLRCCANTRQPLAGEDANLNADVAAVIRGEKTLSGGWGFGGASRRETVMASRALQALTVQLENKGITESGVVDRLNQAVLQNNGALIDVLPRLLNLDAKLARAVFVAICSALQADPPPTAPADIETRKFQFALLKILNDKMGGDTQNRHELMITAQKIMTRTGILSLAKFMGLSREQSTELLVKHLPLDDARYFRVLSSVDVPETIAGDILARPDAASMPPQLAFELLAQVIGNRKATQDDVVNAALAVMKNTAGARSPTNAYVTFGELASAGHGAPVGKQILDALGTSAPELQSVVVACAAEGRLFDANDVADWLIANNDAACIVKVCVDNAELVDKLTDTKRAALATRAISALKSARDGTVFDLARPAFTMVSKLKDAGVVLPGDVTADMTAIAVNAIVRAGVAPIEAYDLRNIFSAAANCGVDVDALAHALLTRDDPFATLPASNVLKPEYYAAACLEVARAMPNLDMSPLLLTLKNGSTRGPVSAAFDVLMSGTHSDAVDRALCDAGIRWAADASEFSTVLDMRRRLEEPGEAHRLLAFDAALTEAVAARPEIWQGVPEARAVVARIKLGDMADAIRDVAQGGAPAEAAADALASEILGSGASAAELVPHVLDAIRRQTRALRPSLDEVQVVLDVPTAGARNASAKTAAQKIEFHGFAQVTPYAGGRGYARVPEQRPFTVTEGTVRNARKIINPLESSHPFVIVLGPPGVAKTFLVEQYAAITGTPLVTTDGGPERTTYDARGGWSSDRHGNAIFQKAEELKAIEQGGIVCDDEFNINPLAVLQQAAASISATKSGYFIRTDKNELVKVSPHYKRVFLGNYLSEEIPESIRRHAHIVYVDPFSIADQKAIAGDRARGIDDESLELLATMQGDVEATLRLTQHQGEDDPTTRNLLRAAGRADRYRGTDAKMAAARAARETYIDGILDTEDVLNDKGEVTRESDRTRIAKSFETVFGMKPEETLPNPESIVVKQGADRVAIGEASVNAGPSGRVAPSDVTVHAFGHLSPFVFDARSKVELEQIAKSMELQESILYRAPGDTGVLSTIRAFGELTGWPVHVQDVNSETTEYDLFGAYTQRQLDNNATETYFDGGWITQVAKDGGVLVINNVEELTDEVRIKLHRMLADRVVPGDGGTLEPMHPNALIIMRSSKPERPLGEAFTNRLQVRSLKRRSPAETEAILTGVAERLGVAPIIAQNIVRYDGMYRSAMNVVVATDRQPGNMPIPTLGKQICWVEDFAALIRGECYNPEILLDAEGRELDFSEQMANQFVEGGMNYYPVPDDKRLDVSNNVVGSDAALLRNVLRALVENRPSEAEALLA